MKVKLKRTWFYPIDAKPVNDRRVISGGRYRKGIHFMPDELRKYLPRDAVILDGKPVEAEPDHRVEKTLKDFDEDRSASDQFIAVSEAAEAAYEATQEQKKRGPGRPKKNS